MVRRLRDRSSRAERLAIVALSGTWTAGAVLLLLAGRPGRLLERLTLEREMHPLAERVTYVVTEPTALPTEAPAVPTPTLPRTTARPRLTAPRADTGAAPATPRAPAVVPSTLPPIPTTIAPAEPARDASTSRDARSTAGAPAAAVVSGFTRAPDPLAPDSTKHVVRSAMSAGRVRASVLAQQERDEAMRAQAREVMAARAAGTPDPMPMMGTSISVPLPFGGPSRKQRERDRAIHAQNLQALARLQRKADSLAALRRRTADSLRVPRDSSRGEP